MTHHSRPLRTTLALLVAALATGVLAMHAPLFGAPHTQATPRAALPVTTPGHSFQTPSSAPPRHAQVAAPVAMWAVSPGSGEGMPTAAGPPPASSEPVCHDDGAGHGAPHPAHGVACDLSVPSLSAATGLGSAAHLTLFTVALPPPVSGSTPSSWWQHRGPPPQERLHLSLCVIRV